MGHFEYNIGTELLILCIYFLKRYTVQYHHAYIHKKYAECSYNFALSYFKFFFLSKYSSMS